MNYNRVILGGRLTRDIEVKATSGGTTVGNLGLAVNRKWRSKSGEAKEETCFVDCEAWGKTADTMAQYLHKGDPVLIEGMLRLDQWEDTDGKKRSKLKVTIERFSFVGGGTKQGAKSEPVADEESPF